MVEMVTIREEDLIESVADALQYISFYTRWITSARWARLRGRAGPAAKDAIAQILTNSRMCAEGHRPICQDTGIVNASSTGARTAGSNRNARCRMSSTRRAARLPEPENKLRASILADPAFTRRNTRTILRACCA